MKFELVPEEELIPTGKHRYELIPEEEFVPTQKPRYELIPEEEEREVIRRPPPYPTEPSLFGMAPGRMMPGFAEEYPEFDVSKIPPSVEPMAPLPPDIPKAEPSEFGENIIENLKEIGLSTPPPLVWQFLRLPSEERIPAAKEFAKQIWKMPIEMIEPYTSLEKYKEYAYERPVSALIDASIVLGFAARGIGFKNFQGLRGKLNYKKIIEKIPREVLKEAQMTGDFSKISDHAYKAYQGLSGAEKMKLFRSGKAFEFERIVPRWEKRPIQAAEVRPGAPKEPSPIPPPVPKAPKPKLKPKVAPEAEAAVSLETLKEKPNLAVYVLKRKPIHSAEVIAEAERITGKAPTVEAPAPAGPTSVEALARQKQGKFAFFDRRTGKVRYDTSVAAVDIPPGAHEVKAWVDNQGKVTIQEYGAQIPPAAKKIYAQKLQEVVAREKPIPGVEAKELRERLIKPPEEAKTFVEWVKRAGGIWDPSLKGEMAEFTPKESRVMGLIRKEGQPFDTLVTQAIEDRWLPEGSTGDTLREMLRDDIRAMKQKGPRMQPYAALEPGFAKLEKHYREGLQREREYRARGGIRIELPKVTLPEMGIRQKIGAVKSIIGKAVEKLRFYPKLPMDFRNAIRLDVVGALDKARQKVYDKVSHALWGGMGKPDIQKSVELIFARDQLSRTKLGKGNPNISLEEAQAILDKVKTGISTDALNAANRWRDISEEYRQTLIKRGLLDEDQMIEDYAPHYVEDYTPDWAFNVGIPITLKRPFRGYIKKAVGTTKQYRQDSDALLGHLLTIEHNNLIEDFIVRQAAKYDIKGILPRDQKIKLFGKDKAGRVNPPKPGRIYVIDGKRYRAYTPDIPFTRQLFPTPEGYMAMGKYRHVSLIPEEIYNTFKSFSDRGNAPIYFLNRATGYWKSSAILSHFPSFNVNNLIGDTWMALVQHPEPATLLAEYDTALKYLTGKGKGPYFDELKRFIDKHNVKMGTFIAGELPRIRKAHDPLRALLKKSYEVSEFRESINRIAYASTLLKAMKQGKGEAIRKAHAHINTERLTLEDAMGKISRDVLIDYSWVSKGFRRYIRGLLFPFGTWYFKGSPLIWRWTSKNWGKALAIMLGIPVGAAIYNNRNEKIKKLESQLPDYIRHRVHLVFGENPDGSIRVWSFQLPQDVLIGTKIFSMSIDYANRVYNKEMSPPTAAHELLKKWLGREIKGMAYLTGPFIRFFRGIASGKDPYDGSPVYSMDIRHLTAERKFKEQLLYFIKCSVPFLSVSIQNYQRGMPQDVALRRLLQNLAGKGALGIYDVTKKGEVIIADKKYTWDDIAKINWIRNKEMGYLGNIEDEFVASGLNPLEFVQTSAFDKEIQKIYNLWTDFMPELKEIEDPDLRKLFTISMLDRRLTNRITSVSVLRKWHRVRLERAKTPDEKRRIARQYEMVRKLNLLESLKRKPKTARMMEIIKKMKESEIPWGLTHELQ